MALTKQESKRVVAELQHLIEIWGGRKVVATSLRISEARLSQVLNGAQPGIKVLDALSREAHKPLDEILGRQTPELQERVRELEDRVRELERDNRQLCETLEAIIQHANEGKAVVKRCRV